MIPEKDNIITLQYPAHGKSFEGSVSQLPEKLVRIVEFDQVKICGPSPSKKISLFFRRGAKQVFYIRLLRKSGRCIVEVSGLNAQNVLRGIDTCKQHFDQWFGIDSTDIRN